MNPIVEYLGLQNAGPEAEILAKIFRDNLVSLRSQQLMIEHFGFEAIQKMNSLEREKLIKRICPPIDNKVRWIVSRAFQSGRALLIARWRAEEMYFDGPPENGPLIEFHGERPSAETLARYSAAYDPSNVARLDVAYWFAKTAKDKPRFSGE